MHDASALTTSAHRPIRLLDAQETACPGELVTDGNGLCVRMDAARVTEPFWSFAGAEHVAGVRDVVRRPDGQDALLPWCPEPVEAFLGRRAAAESPLSSGETVTLVGSLLRGVAEVAEAGVHGRWWLTDDARPVFVPGEGGECAAAAGEIITRVLADCADRALERLLNEIRAGTRDHRVTMRDRHRWEKELTDLAAPRPLEREVFAPERVASIPLQRARVSEDAVRVTEQRTLRGTLQELSFGFAEQVRQRIPTSRGAGKAADGHSSAGRRRLVLVGTAAAAAVLAGGLMWPGGQDDSSATDAAARAASPTPSLSGQMADSRSAAETAPSGTAAATDPERASAEPVSPGETDAVDDVPGTALADGSAEHAATLLLDAVAACIRAGDADCPHAVVDGSADAVLPRVDAADPAREITLVEDYGGVAVLRLGGAKGQGQQMLVLATMKDRWLVRDIYDIADQPSGKG